MTGNSENRKMSAASRASTANSMTLRAESPYGADRLLSQEESDLEDNAGTAAGGSRR